MKEVTPFPGGESVHGLKEQTSEFLSKRYSEEFISAGIRTYRTIAIIKLEEIVDKKENKISIAKAQDTGLIPPGYEPILSLRAMGTFDRVDYVTSRPNVTFIIERLTDAMNLVAQELGENPENFTRNRYLEWFATNLGQGIAKIHKLKYLHGNISTHNVTLDCRIIDLDTVKPLEKSEGDPEGLLRYNGEMQMAFSGIIPVLLKTVLRDKEGKDKYFKFMEHLAHLYKRAYEKEFGVKVDLEIFGRRLD